MVDISHLTRQIGQPENKPEPAEQQIRNAMESAGLTPPEEIHIDGKLHRFSGDGKRDKASWYIVYPDGIRAGSFGCWRQGVQQNWREDIGRQLSPAEQMEVVRRQSEAKAERDRERSKRQEVAQDGAEYVWSAAAQASDDHPYLKRKGIGAHGARVSGDGALIVPMYSADGEIASVQFIQGDGSKKYMSGCPTKGASWWIGAIDRSTSRLYVAEGFATAATIHEETGAPCAIAYTASALPDTVGRWREYLGAGPSITVVADNDESGTGRNYADQAAAKHGAHVVIPPQQGDANDYKLDGGDLQALLTPPKQDWLIAADDFASKPEPIKWHLKYWVQDRALIMVHGPSGSGKTFVVLDWMLSMASGRGEWCGNRASHAPVLYLAGEGHQGLRARIAGWKRRKSNEPLRMWLSKDGCDLNTDIGYQRVSESVRQLPETPSVICVDTLHRFLLGDENSAQDAKSMLDACAALQSEFGAAVILVHHTGNSEEAQHRARGSSAWKGALDIEASVVPPKHEGDPIQVINRKAKDFEPPHAPVYMDLERVELDGWFDEDGEQVTTAVAVEAPPPSETARNTKTSEMIKTIERSWMASGAETIEGKPYVSRSALIDFLIQNDGMSEASAKAAVKPSHQSRLIGYLLNGEIIERRSHGWVVSEPETMAAMMIKAE
jgi:phage/plasmid primase-like uncharacterized protein